jgi:CxxC motif-containing protein (DUF1111 family)
MRTSLLLLSVFLGLLLLTLTRSFSSADTEADVAGKFGDPIPGLGAFDLQAFQRGKDVFTKRFTRAEGLGPHFNATSCRSCHETPAPGGSSQRYRDFFLLAQKLPDGTTPKFFPDCAAGTDPNTVVCLPSIVVPNYGPLGTAAAPVAASVAHVPIPGGDNLVVARRNAPPLFGVGLFRLVSDEEILSRADPDDLDGDGISGRVNRIAKEDNHIGRFGFKCQAVSIEAFNRGALNNQMGITSDSTELKLGDAAAPEAESILARVFGSRKAYAQVAEPKDRVTDFDGVPDPEISRQELLDLVFFQEHLAAPRRGFITPAVSRGEEVFRRIGCAACHAPSLSTPLGAIHPYTDLLIHEMGSALADGIVMAQAGLGEFRTQPLWGLCQHAPFLHDGRADSVGEAINAHGGEAAAAQGRYASLSTQDHEDLHRFLESL